MNTLAAKLGLASASSLIVVESVSVEPLLSVLITLAISIVSVLMVEGVQLLKKYLRKKIDDLEKNKSSKDKENKK